MCFLSTQVTDAVRRDASIDYGSWTYNGYCNDELQIKRSSSRRCNTLEYPPRPRAIIFSGNKQNQTPNQTQWRQARKNTDMSGTDIIARMFDNAVQTDLEIKQIRRAKQQEAEHQELLTRLNTAEMDNSGNLAEKYALRAALAKISPNHPLLTNAALQEKIRESGKKAVSITNDYDAARDVGTTFKY